MAGNQSEVDIASNGRGTVVRTLAMWGIGSTLALAMGCSDLDDGSESFCDLPANQGIGDCATVQGPDMTDPWWCMDKGTEVLAPPRMSQLVGFLQPVLDWGSRLPLAGRGLTATLCQGFQSSCDTPIALPTIGASQTIQTGMLGPTPFPASVPPGVSNVVAGVVVPEGFDGFIKFNMPAQYMPDAYYLGGEISGDISTGGPILMLNDAARATILQDSFRGTPPSVTEQNGLLTVSTYDCNGNIVSGGRIELQKAGEPVPGVIPFQVPASRIPVAQPADRPLVTSSSGFAGYLNVPPGTVEIIAYRPGTDDRFGSIVMGAVPGQLSLGPIRPDYRRNASVSRNEDMAADMP